MADSFELEPRRGAGVQTTRRAESISSDHEAHMRWFMLPVSVGAHVIAALAMLIVRLAAEVEWPSPAPLHSADGRDDRLRLFHLRRHPSDRRRCEPARAWREPRKIRCAAIYPPIALNARIGGAVVLEVVINERGVIEEGEGAAVATTAGRRGRKRGPPLASATRRRRC